MEKQITKEEFIKIICEGNKVNTQELPKEFLDNKELALKAVEQEPYSLKYFSDALKDDEEVVKKAISQWYMNYNFKDINGNPLKCWSGTAIKYASPRLQKKEDVILLAAKEADWRLWNALPCKIGEFPVDDELYFKAVILNPHLYISPRSFKDNKEFALKVCGVNGEALKDFSNEIKKDKDVIGVAVKNDAFHAFKYMAEELKQDKKFILSLIKINTVAFRFCNEELKNNKKFVMAAIKENVQVFNELSEELKKDSEILEARDEAQPNITKAAKVASEWWVENMGSYYQNVGNLFNSLALSMKTMAETPKDKNIIKKFEKALKEELISRMMREESNIVLSTDYSAKGILYTVAHDNGVSDSAFPCKSVMCVSSKEVTVRKNLGEEIILFDAGAMDELTL